jgi:hypothetical protein
MSNHIFIVSCPGDNLHRLRPIYPRLVQRFDAKKVVGWMFAQHAIRLPELQSILSCRTACEAAEGLLKIILNEQSDSIFECFRAALNQTNQQHVASWISFDGNVTFFLSATYLVLTTGQVLVDHAGVHK